MFRAPESCGLCARWGALVVGALTLLMAFAGPSQAAGESPTIEILSPVEGFDLPVSGRLPTASWIVDPDTPISNVTVFWVLRAHVFSEPLGRVVEVANSTDEGPSANLSVQNSAHVRVNVTLEVTARDPEGNVATARVNGTMKEAPPMAAEIDSHPLRELSSGGYGLEWTFNASTARGVGPLTYSWDFADGSTSSEAFAEHRFPRAGTYAVQLTVTDQLGQTVTRTQSIPASEERAVTEIPVWAWALLLVALIGAVAWVATSARRRAPPEGG